MGDRGQIARDSIEQMTGTSSEVRASGLNPSCTVGWVQWDTELVANLRLFSLGCKMGERGVSYDRIMVRD